MVFPGQGIARVRIVFDMHPPATQAATACRANLATARAPPFLLRKGGLRHPQLSRAADLPTMCWTIGAARMASTCASPAMPCVASRGRYVTPVANGRARNTAYR
ncbi:hypothetical protein DF147_27005 [Burkholderia cenocepacia]|nr:hypothetical protein DF147_27005 [Burkholderia cenocepacia]RQV80371.1 hypothetical protein DF019_34155 [Burkholderia cenocepacia]